jgi:hypothetical protein
LWLLLWQGLLLVLLVLLLLLLCRICQLLSDWNT